MKAIIETQGHQYVVREGDELEVDQYVTKREADFDAEGNRLHNTALEPGTTVIIDRVLSIGEGEDLKIGKPLVEGASVEAEILELYKDKKVIIYKKRRRHGYQRRNGHRQRCARIKITKINA